MDIASISMPWSGDRRPAKIDLRLSCWENSILTTRSFDNTAAAVRISCPISRFPSRMFSTVGESGGKGRFPSHPNATAAIPPPANSPHAKNEPFARFPGFATLGESMGSA